MAVSFSPLEVLTAIDTKIDTKLQEYATKSALTTAHPTPNIGMFAIVVEDESNDGETWLYQSMSGTWVAVTQFGGGEGIGDLSTLIAKLQGEGWLPAAQ